MLIKYVNFFYGNHFHFRCSACIVHPPKDHEKFVKTHQNLRTKQRPGYSSRTKAKQNSRKFIPGPDDVTKIEIPAKNHIVDKVYDDDDILSYEEITSNPVKIKNNKLPGLFAGDVKTVQGLSSDLQKIGTKDPGDNGDLKDQQNDKKLEDNSNSDKYDENDGLDLKSEKGKISESQENKINLMSGQVYGQNQEKLQDISKEDVEYEKEFEPDYEESQNDNLESENDMKTNKKSEDDIRREILETGDEDDDDEVIQYEEEESGALIKKDVDKSKNETKLPTENVVKPGNSADNDISPEEDLESKYDDDEYEEDDDDSYPDTFYPDDYESQEASTIHSDYKDPDEQEYDSEGSNCIFSRDFFLSKKSQIKKGTFHERVMGPSLGTFFVCECK